MKIGELSAIGAALCWTINGMFLESSGKKLGLGPVNFLRLVFGLAFISVFLKLTTGTFLPVGLGLTSWTYLSISGIIGFFIGDYFLIKSMLLIGPRMSMLMMSLSPPMAAIFDYIIYQTIITPLKLLGMLITLTGVAVVITGKSEKGITIGAEQKTGILYGALGALGQAGGLMFSKIGMGSSNPFAATWIRIIAAIIIFLVIMVLTRDFTKITTALEFPREIWKVVMAGLTGPFIGVGLSLLALQYTQAGIASTLSSIMPITILPFSVIIYKERIRLIEIFGTILSVVGIGILFLM